MRKRFTSFLSKFPFSIRPSKRVLVSLLVLLAVIGLRAQEKSEPNQQSKNMVVLPVGTSIPLVLTHSLASRSVHRGDNIYAQITSPVLSGKDVAIPAGTLVQGGVATLDRKGNHAEVVLQSISLIFQNSYVVAVAGPLRVESEEGYVQLDPSSNTKTAAMILPFAGTGLGALIGHAISHGSNPGYAIPVGTPGSPTTPFPNTSNNLKGIAIGSIVGAGAGGIGSLLLISRSHGFYLDAGSPMQMVLQQPLELDKKRVAEAIRNGPGTSIQPVIPAPRLPATMPGTVASGPASCRAGQEWCNGSCMDPIDFVSDSSNCGRCGNRCSINESCTGGFCGCAGGYSSCMGSCVSDASFLSDTSNCGRCGNICSIGESCTGGTCMKMP